MQFSIILRTSFLNISNSANYKKIEQIFFWWNYLIENSIKHLNIIVKNELQYGNVLKREYICVKLKG